MAYVPKCKVDFFMRAPYQKRVESINFISTYRTFGGQSKSSKPAYEALLPLDVQSLNVPCWPILLF